MMMHAHGEAASDETASKTAMPTFVESWRRKLEENRQKQSCRAEQVTLAICDGSVEEVAKERKAGIDARLASAHTASKRLRFDTDAGEGRCTRRRLRESLVAKASELKHEQERRLEKHLLSPAPHKPKQKRIKLKGDDAITRLINLGRQSGSDG